MKLDESMILRNTALKNLSKAKSNESLKLSKGFSYVKQDQKTYVLKKGI